MRISQWTRFLSVPVWLRVASAEAAPPNNHDTPIYDSRLGGNQQSLLALCPDYTDYARCKQYVTIPLIHPLSRY